jgi:hypothetical protein
MPQEDRDKAFRDFVSDLRRIRKLAEENSLAA